MVVIISLDKFLLDLKEKGVGCFCRHCSAGVLAYADDVILLAPYASGPRVMLHACEDFALSNGLSFNSLKTQLITFSLFKVTVTRCTHAL